MPFPHLPPQACSIKTHNRLQLLPWAVFIILVSALCSAAVALSVVSWFLPNMLPDSSLALRGTVNTANRIVLDPILNRKIKQSLLTIYDAREKANSSFYKQDADVGEAALLSSDGWAVMGEVSDKVSAKRYWEVVDAQGKVYQIEKFVADPVSGLTYFKIAGEGFRVTAFYQWTGSEEEGQTLWSVGKDEWKEIFLGEPELKIANKEIFSIWKPQYAFGLLPEGNSGTIILDTQGELTGIIDSAGRLIPGWLVENQLSNLLTKGETAYSALPYLGYLVEGISSDARAKSVIGFYVTYNGAKSSAEGIVAGDIIIKINNQLIDKADLARQILLAPEEMTLSVLRQGIESDIMVKKERVTGN